MLICRVESFDIFGNRAAVLVPGHCRTRVPFFFLSFIIMIRTHKSWFGCNPASSFLQAWLLSPSQAPSLIPRSWLGPETGLGSGSENQHSGATSQYQAVNPSWKPLFEEPEETGGWFRRSSVPTSLWTFGIKPPGPPDCPHTQVWCFP